MSKEITGITLDADTADGIAKAVLLDAYETVVDSVANMEADTDFPDYRLPDLDFERELVEALKVVLTYFTVASERPWEND